MKKGHLIIAVICSLTLLLLSGCYKDGDGKLELKEPKKELSECRLELDGLLTGQ